MLWHDEDSVGMAERDPYAGSHLGVNRWDYVCDPADAGPARHLCRNCEHGHTSVQSAALRYYADLAALCVPQLTRRVPTPTLVSGPGGGRRPQCKAVLHRRA